MSSKKTHSPLAATHMAGARTVVMDRPPEMTLVLGPESRVRSDSMRATRIAPSPTPSIMTTTVFRAAKQRIPSGQVPLPRVSSPPPPPGARRTRMVDLKDALAGQALPPLPCARSMSSLAHSPPPASPPALPPPPPAMRPARVWVDALRERRSLLLVAAAAIVILVVMVPLSSREGGEALAEAQAPPQLPTPPPAPPLLPVPGEQRSSAPDGPGQAQAGALLLSGRRGEALAMYRRLAESSDSDEGIDAMIIVLEQKVNAP